ncbi:cytochrome P450 [Musa troglodytarum]|uniref:Cytochrome P450 n=1 Tax=Musa troglodytarum TaxID=320322 RepID=A0A9E7F620_9LILI|nr:cytochrome P450 [Musa troglodytarum]
MTASAACGVQRAAYKFYNPNGTDLRFILSKQEETLNTEVAAAEAPVNLSEKIFTLSNTVASQATFGKRSDHQDRFIPLGQLGGLCVIDRFPSLKPLDVLTGARFRLQQLHRHLDEIIEESEAKAEARSGRPMDEVADLVDVPLRVRDEPFPMTVGRMKAIIFVRATCHLLVVIIHLLGDRPRSGHRSRAAQLHQIGHQGDLRLHPSAPLIPMLCTKTCDVPGHEIQAGTRVFVNVWAVGRDPRYWDDAESFKPERFQGSAMDFRGVDFEYVPFGAARRMCRGIGFGMATVELLFYLDWRLPGGMRPEDLHMGETFGLVAARKTELKLLATPHVVIVK